MSSARSAKGLLIAGLILIVWGIVLVFNLTFVWYGTAQIPLMLLAVSLSTFLYTGLFITAHDGMHGTIFPGADKINRYVAALALRLFAGLSFKRLLAGHIDHHKYPGTARDPDYYVRQPQSFWKWYSSFLRSYLSWSQIVLMAVVYNVLKYVLGIADWQLMVFWLLPMLLSTLQLFYFGTYLPHRREHNGNFSDTHNSRSNDYSVWLSFITCYHFGYHHEHHLYPGKAWWQLPEIRAGRL
jgi:beta-carotene ketolase (CrtW type)